MLYVVTNAPTVHLSLPEAPLHTLCGRHYRPGECSAVTQKPGKGFKPCANCGKVARGRRAN